jgi:hypothetical protein
MAVLAEVKTLNKQKENQDLVKLINSNHSRKISEFLWKLWEGVYGC